MYGAWWKIDEQICYLDLCYVNIHIITASCDEMQFLGLSIQTFDLIFLLDEWWEWGKQRV